MTMLTIMTKKDYLERSRKSNRYIYKPIVTKEEITSGMLGDIVNRVFDGSTMAAVVNLLETGDIEEPELTELRKIIRQKERTQ